MSGHKDKQASINASKNKPVITESQSTQASQEPVSLIVPFHKNTILTTVGGRKTQALIDYVYHAFQNCFSIKLPIKIQICTHVHSKR